MTYSFFGTCANDYDQFFGCLETILKQTKKPTQIILVNSGEKDIKHKILSKLNNSEINLVYVKKKLNRVKSLNIAIDFSISNILLGLILEQFLKELCRKCFKYFK